MGGTQHLEPPKGKQIFGSQPLEFLELLWTEGERPEVKQHYLLFPVSYQLFKTAQQIKHRHFLSARPVGLLAPHDKFQSFLQAAGGCPSPTEENWPHQPTICQGRTWPRQSTLSPQHQLCLFAVAEWARNPGPQEVSPLLGNWVACRGWRASSFSSKTTRERRREKKRCLPGLWNIFSCPQALI